ncbi:MAG: hypothetical protein K8I02_03945 [Candidatus Methylomirabilis sp.]|nr:hypothetical protein [Deltaproteobacteria bacterium]
MTTSPRRSALALLLAAGILPAIAGCGETTAPKTGPEIDLLSGLGLDNGKRWSADEHTGRVAGEMVAAVRRAAGRNDAAATTALGNELQELLNRLVAGCTMQGPAHEALHVYLSALMPRVSTMHGGDAAAASRARAEVARLLERFADYFG